MRGLDNQNPAINGGSIKDGCLLLFFLAMIPFLSFGFFTLGFNEGLKVGEKTQAVAIKQHPFVQVQEKCSRCGEMCDRPRMTCYLLDGKPGIQFCPKCVYQQADSFIKFCPVEAEE